MSIVDLLDSKVGLSVFTVVFTVAYGYTAMFLLRKSRERRAAKKKSFFETAIQGLLDGTIESSEDLTNVYKGVTDLSSEDLTYRAGLNRWLRQILSQLIARKIGEDLEVNKVNDLKKKINDFIKANERASPFADLPDTERNMLNDVRTYSAAGDKESVERKITELSSVIQTRYEDQKKLEAQNRWSIPLAVIGLVLTVLFGVLSIF